MKCKIICKLINNTAQDIGMYEVSRCFFSVWQPRKYVNAVMETKTTIRRQILLYSTYYVYAAVQRLSEGIQNNWTCTC